MKTIKSTFAAVITAATLITSGVAPVTQAHAESIVLAPGIAKKIGPGVLKPGIGKPLCVKKPWLCGPGLVKVPPAKPVPPKPPKGGLTDAQKLGIGILGAVAIGAVVANSRQQPNPGPYNQHLAYCHGKYKTFDPATNSFMSNAGYRKPCISPFLR